MNGSETGATGTVFGIQPCCLHDGPGVRTVVYLKGCSLGCLWCHNPEGLSPLPQIAHISRLCIGCGACAQICPRVHAQTPKTHSLRRSACKICGLCVRACPVGALELVGRTMTVEQVLADVRRDKPYYDLSGGGLTLSGGEPLSQPDFALALLRRAKAEGLHTAVETAGFCDLEVLERVVSFTDLFLFDYKETDPSRHQALTGADNSRILCNLEALAARGVPLVLRCPVIPGVNDGAEHFTAIARLTQRHPGILGFEVMPYHRLGTGKSKRLGMPELTQFDLCGPEAAERWTEAIASLGGRPYIPEKEAQK